MPENEFEFRAVYDGEGLREGSMDARDLAPALLGFADLVDNGARLVVPEAPAVTVRVRSDFQRGSFDIALQIAGAYNQFVSLFSGAQAQAWSTLLSLLGISGVGVFQLIKRAKGRKPTVISIERSEKVTLSVEGDDQIEIPKAVWNLFNNSGFVARSSA
jgi:hypothetical protein